MCKPYICTFASGKGTLSAIVGGAMSYVFKLAQTSPTLLNHRKPKFNPKWNVTCKLQAICIAFQLSVTKTSSKTSTPVMISCHTTFCNHHDNPFAKKSNWIQIWKDNEKDWKISTSLPDEQITKPPPEAPPVVLEPARHFSHPLDSLSFFSQPLPTELQAV